MVLTVGGQVDERVQPGGAGEQTSSFDWELDPEADCSWVTEHWEELSHHADGTSWGL